MVRNNKVIVNLMWRFLEKFSNQIITLIISTIIARILEPSVYGTFSLVTIITSFLSVFVDSGMAVSLIQKENVDELDLSSAFYFNLTVGIVLYIIVYLMSPLIASIFNNKDLIKLIRVLSLIIIISSVQNIEYAYISRNLLFRYYFITSLFSNTISGLIGIYLALKGYGVWSLVWQILLSNICYAIILNVFIKWKPIKKISFSRISQLLSFGWKIMISDLISSVYNNGKSLIIGKAYSISDLAFYKKGDAFPSRFVSSINYSIDSVLLPTMAIEQNNIKKIKEITKRTIKLSTYLIFPMMIGLSVCAKPLVSLALTDKWLPCIPYLRIFCFVYALNPVDIANLNAIKALGKSNTFMKIGILKKVIGIIILLFMLNKGPVMLACSSLLITPICQIIDSYPNKTLIEYGFKEQLKDMLPQIIISIIMGIIVLSINLLKMNNLATLLIQIIIGIVVYVILSIIFKVDSFYYVVDFLIDKNNN